jgi:hypothetical protein
VKKLFAMLFLLQVILLSGCSIKWFPKDRPLPTSKWIMKTIKGTNGQGDQIKIVEENPKPFQSPHQINDARIYYVFAHREVNNIAISWKDYRTFKLGGKEVTISGSLARSLDNGSIFIRIRW